MKPLAYAVLSALLYVAGYPAGFGVWICSCVALVPLLVCIERYGLSTRRAFGLGALFAVLAQLIGYAFLPETLRRFSGLPWIACVLAHVLLCVAQAGGTALWFAALAFLRARGFSSLVLAPPLWVVAELTWPTVFEAPFGAALHNEPGLLQTAELGGVGLVSLLLVALNASVAAIALAQRTSDRAARTRAALAFGLVSLVFAAGLARFLDVRIATRRAPRLSVGLVQATLPAEAKRRDPEGYAAQYIELSSLARDPVDVLIWPETALARPVPATVRDMHEAHPSLARVRAPLLTGAVTRDGDRIYNSALLFDAERRLAGRVDKQKLLPFAERIPFGESFPQLYALIPGAGRFTPGTGAPILVLPRARVATFICYEDMLSGLVRRAAVDGRADVLVSLTNDAWFGESQAAYTHYAVAKLRAIELRRSLVRATNTGVTAIIDPTGAVTTSAPEHQPAAVVARVPLMTVQTVYARWGNAPLAAIVLAWLAVPALRRARAFKRSPQANRSSSRSPQADR